MEQILKINQSHKRPKQIEKYSIIKDRKIHYIRYLFITILSSQSS